MRKFLVLLIFFITTGVVSWNTVGFLAGDDYLIEETMSEESEFDTQEEENEVEEFNEHFLELSFFAEGIPSACLVTIPSIKYQFTISTFCLEPEINPPRC